MEYKKLEQDDLDLTPEDTYQLLLNNEVDFIEISLCGGSSSIKIKKGDTFLVDLTDLDYNGHLINKFRWVLQDINKDENVRVLEEAHTNKHGVSGVVHNIEICSSNGVTQRYSVTSSGINNKYNRLRIERTISTTNPGEKQQE